MQAIVRLFAIAALCVATGASAQTVNKPVRVIVSFAAGTVVDLGARMFSDGMSKRLGQPVIVENRVGAGGTIGAKAVADSPPDGGNLYFGGVVSISPLLTKNNPVDALKDFAPVSNMMAFYTFFLVDASKPYFNSLQDMVSYSKSNPNKLNMGATPGLIELMFAMMKERTGVSYTFVPYGGGGVQPANLVSELDATISGYGAFAPFIQAGKVKALFTLGPTRSSLAPQVPTAGEYGIPNFASANNFGLWAAAGTPRDLAQALSAAAAATIKTPEVSAQVRKLTLEPHGSTPEEQRKIAEDEQRFWSEAVKITGFKPAT